MLCLCTSSPQDPWTSPCSRTKIHHWNWKRSRQSEGHKPQDSSPDQDDPSQRALRWWGRRQVRGLLCVIQTPPHVSSTAWSWLSFCFHSWLVRIFRASLFFYSLSFCPGLSWTAALPSFTGTGLVSVILFAVRALESSMRQSPLLISFFKKEIALFFNLIA